MTVTKNRTVETTGETETATAVQRTPRAGATGKILWTWFVQELKLLLREPVAVFFSLAFPLVIYVFIGIPYANEKLDDGTMFIDLMFAALISTVAANLLLMGLPIYLAELRTRLVIKRYRIIPLPGYVFAVASLAAMLTLVLAASGIIIGVVASQHGVHAAAGNWRFLAILAGMIAWLAIWGFFLGTLPVSARTTQALSAVVFFVMFFGSGATVPLDGLPQLFQDVLAYNPMKQWLDVLAGYYTGAELTQEHWLKLLYVVPVTAVLLFFGLRFWRRS